MLSIKVKIRYFLAKSLLSNICLSFFLSAPIIVGLSKAKQSKKPPQEYSIPGTKCDIKALEHQMRLKLNAHEADTNFTVYLEKRDGHSFQFQKGQSSLASEYKSASTSKWVSAFVILWVVSKAKGFTLNSIPSDYLKWSMPKDDPLYRVTLRQLLSFTSGMHKEPGCLKFGFPSKSFDKCLNDTWGSLVSVNKGRGYPPGTSFYYGSAHLQLAGAMAVKAGGYNNWAHMWSDFNEKTGLFTSSTYNLPSNKNPRLAGGMTWIGHDYVKFLRTIFNHEKVNSPIIRKDLLDQMFTNQLSRAKIVYSPVLKRIKENWSYGLGVWLECPRATFTCKSVDYYSSPGAYGAYPFISFKKSYFGLIARQGSLGTFPEGLETFRSIKNLSESWAVCGH